MKFCTPLLSITLGLLFFYSCSLSEPFYTTSELENSVSGQSYQNADTLHTFLLIGDTGDPELNRPDPFYHSFSTIWRSLRITALPYSGNWQHLRIRKKSDILQQFVR